MTCSKDMFYIQRNHFGLLESSLFWGKMLPVYSSTPPNQVHRASLPYSMDGTGSIQLIGLPTSGSWNSSHFPSEKMDATMSPDGK